MLLEAQHLDFGHGRRAIGRDLALSLERGQVLCLLGPNGSGKTTLFRTLLGLLPALGGTIRIEGRDTRGWSRRHYARAAAYVPQNHRPVFSFTVADLVLMGRTAHLDALAQPGATDRAIALDCLARLGLSGLATRRFAELSGGQQQMVLVARALAQEARLIILDEPAASLDFGNRVRLLGEIRRLADQGLGIILSTHEPDHALQIADQVVLLAAGQAVAAGPPAGVLTTERLSQVYGVPVEVIELTDGRRLCRAPLRTSRKQGVSPHLFG